MTQRDNLFNVTLSDTTLYTSQKNNYYPFFPHSYVQVNLYILIFSYFIIPIVFAWI